MKGKTIFISAVVLDAKLSLCSINYPDCPPFSGDLNVNIRNIYPEGVEWSPSNCKIYLGSLNNGSIVEYDPYTSATNIIEFPGVSHNWEYFVCGVDYSHATGNLYVSASARAPWFNQNSPGMGTNLTGPNRLIQYSPRDRSIIREVDLDPLINDIEKQLGSPVGGLQDSASDKDGNTYVPVTFGNFILKVDKNGEVNRFYTPDLDKLDKSYGFGGLFITEDNAMVLSDGISQSFVVFNLSGPNPAEPHFSKPEGFPDNYDRPLECDAVIAPRRYRDRVAMCADVLSTSISPHGIITVYVSNDGWKTNKCVGAIPIAFGQSPDVFSTAQFATADRVYALSSALPYGPQMFPEVESTTLVDITARVDELVGDAVASQHQRDEL
ncbi:hypothetical protein F4801DRAFT_602912 [Xylaria longipes]|nr:hypothetical protein F4801DRAFT_602912 [Xylaria longipes]RYC56916.1 hypothetical protein CHU98_g9286 [Xylaria longipes]